MTNPFEYVKTINSTHKTNLMRGTENDEIAESDYNPWLTNLAMSQHLDTVMYANELNRVSYINNRAQYEIYLNAVRPGKRFGKWNKSEIDEEMVVMVGHIFKCGRSTAISYVELMSEDQKNELRKAKGGKE